MPSSPTARDAAEGLGAAEAMRDLRWRDLGPGRADIIAPDGLIWGWVEPVTAGTRGVVINPVLRSQAQMLDHPDETAARAWVESEVRGLGETIPFVDKKER